MDVNIIYNIEHEMPLGILISLYFYLTGLSAGSFIISTFAYGFGMVKFKPLGKIGVVMATLLLVIAPMTLLVDLEQPLRFWHLILYLRITSPITWGTFLLTLYPMNCVVYGYFMFRGDMKRTKIFGLIGIPLALMVHGYTGFILALGKARVLWNTAIMPPIFLVSAMVSGLAMMTLVVIIKDYVIQRKKEHDPTLIYDLGKLLVASIVLDLILIGTDLTVLLTSHTEAYKAAVMLIKGSFSPLFLGVEIFLGSIIPLLLLLSPFTKRWIPGIAIASLLVMIGIFAMRCIMVIGGLSIPLS
ncbi:MAG: oxidoreductase [Deltaproteobacteria bacterium CG_4_8_14_3_um_filter_45_9]|nr:MAG: oxidoreductase [Deltaproteobacteria bacterium CG03_land_8_20_14_0_80_45_14]PIX25617.1 MAG: oxidoreductase [Deltaproteobacteria bacterium CG_4_8_14_3_um_filter_45_9]